MYRQYEDPFELQRQLEDLKREYNKELNNGADEDVLMSLAETIADFKERINFAWQDDEDESEGY